jgi:hypothetical protein
VILLESFPVWSTSGEHFYPLMRHLRRWEGFELQQGQLQRHKDAVIHALECCRMDVERIVSGGFLDERHEW